MVAMQIFMISESPAILSKDFESRTSREEDKHVAFPDVAPGPETYFR